MQEDRSTMDQMFKPTLAMYSSDKQGPMFLSTRNYS